MPSNGPTEFNKWLEFTSSFIKKKLAEAQNSSNNKVAQAENSSKVNNSHNMNGNDTISSSSSNNSTSSSDANNCSEALLLQNAQLQKSLDEYKNIVADTVRIVSLVR